MSSLAPSEPARARVGDHECVRARWYITPNTDTKFELNSKIQQKPN